MTRKRKYSTGRRKGKPKQKKKRIRKIKEKIEAKPYDDSARRHKEFWEKVKEKEGPYLPSSPPKLKRLPYPGKDFKYVKRKIDGEDYYVRVRKRPYMSKEERSRRIKAGMSGRYSFTEDTIRTIKGCKTAKEAQRKTKLSLSWIYVLAKRGKHKFSGKVGRPRKRKNG